MIKDGRMKNAGVLFFCRDITGFIPQATVTCVLYQGKTKYKILDRKNYEEDIYSNYVNGINYLLAKLNSEYIIKSGPHEEKPKLPEEALREGLLNALAHRDYYVYGANILVEVFQDRVEITNPGGLVNGLTMEDLGRKSLSRNTLITGLMQRMDLIEKVGSGISRMKNAMADYGFSGPEFDVNENCFTIIFRRPLYDKKNQTGNNDLKSESTGRKTGETVREAESTGRKTGETVREAESTGRKTGENGTLNEFMDYCNIVKKPNFHHGIE